MRIAQSVAELIGHTPLLALNRWAAARGAKARIVAKLESFNPAGSAKDRVALSIIARAEEAGLIGAGATVIEPTSGNTGIGLAAVAAARGYRAVMVMPDTMSVERQKLIRAYGAEVMLSPGAEGMQGAIALAEKLQRETPNSILGGQFANPANPLAHYEGTGPEIWEDAGGAVDIFVATAGTGGTVTGAGRYLKEKNPAVRVVAVEPAESPVISGGKPGPHGIQGIGAGFVPDILDTELIDEVITVSTEEAYAAACELGRTEGVLAGISSGAALQAAARLARRPENAGKTIVVLLTDTGERYLSTGLYG
ncbi:MAG: cysteine synthase A [Duodenibacillus sp.]|nr:cysteine synthase A [Duodenibacillus sp.]